jgi:hypothetical protein
MAIRRLPVLPGIQRRSAADHQLSHLFAEVVAARAADRVARGTRHPDKTRGSDSGRLAASLSAYVKALERYRLPVPRTIRDELRLRREVAS